MVTQQQVAAVLLLAAAATVGRPTGWREGGGPRPAHHRLYIGGNGGQVVGVLAGGQGGHLPQRQLQKSLQLLQQNSS